MATYYMENFGCRATQADAAAIEQQLLEGGFRTASAAQADLFVVNTCTVTASADSRARQAIRSFHRRNPAGKILVTGCYAQRAPEELSEIEGVRWVVGNAHQREIARIATRDRDGAGHGAFVPVERLSGTAKAGDRLPLASGPANILTGNLLERADVLLGPPRTGASGHTRPTLKIQDGCNHRCAYCVIPLVRGTSRSLTAELAVSEIRRLTGAGAREVVLSGIDLGSYGRDLRPRMSLGELVERIVGETGLERLRLSSLEPFHLTSELIEQIAFSERIAPHFHIPLQSGSDRILAAMHRWYRAAHYAERIEMIRRRLPDAAIGADVIAGFPGESEEDHRETLRLVERLPFTYLHVFSFSPRPGTEAARMAGLVDGETIRRRARELRALGEEKAAAFRRRQSGRPARALTLETVRNGMRDALTANYLTVAVEDRWPANRWLDLRLRETASGALAGEPTGDAP
jgi:threonylcarbamoyladenosine tRNA methylthiotransferase MtaB